MCLRVSCLSTRTELGASDVFLEGRAMLNVVSSGLASAMFFPTHDRVGLPIVRLQS